MKRIGSILLILGILLSYLSCGSRTAARRHTLDYLHTMSEQFEKGDFEALSATRIEFGEELERMNDADNADVLQAVVDFMKELQEQRGRSFSDYFGKLANYGEEISWKMPFYLMTRVYDAADAIIYDHAPDTDIRAYLQLRSSADPFIYSRDPVMDEAVDAWKAKRKQIEDERSRRWEKENAQWEGKRIITATSIGPIQVGSSILSLPNRMEGFYDYLVKEVQNDSYAETDIAWEETHYIAWYAEQRVFDLMTTVRDLDMFDDYEPDEDTDYSTIVSFTVYSPDYQTASGLSLQMSGDELFDAGGCGVHYGTGEKIWHSDGRPSEMEEYTGIYLEGLLFRYNSWQIGGYAESVAEKMGYAGYRLERSQMSTFSRPREIYSIADGWIEQFLENRIPEEESIYDASFSDFVLPESFDY